MTRRHQLAVLLSNYHGTLQRFSNESGIPSRIIESYLKHPIDSIASDHEKQFAKMFECNTNDLYIDAQESHNPNHRYREVGFSPATLGGLAVELHTEKGLFFVFIIDGNPEHLEFNYAEDGENFIRAADVDLNYPNGTYAALKTHVQNAIEPFHLQERAVALEQKYHAHIRALKEKLERQRKN